MENETNAMVKRSLLLTAKLVGAFALWVTVLSLLLVSLTARMVGALSGVSNTASTREEPANSQGQPGTPRPNLKGASAAAKSNG